MEKKKYNIIYSLGADCACAIYLNKHNLRKTSGPFDWLTNAPLKNRLELILNDFENFFDFGDMKFLPKNPLIANDDNYDYYENLRNGFYYYHDFPVGMPIEKAFKAAKEKYVRRIKRFVEKVKSSEKVLFIWLAHNHENKDELVKKLCDRITAKYNKNIDFLLVEHDASKADGEIEVLNIALNITRYKMATAASDEKGNPTTLGNEANCNKVFEGLEVIEPFCSKLSSALLKFATGFICLFIPSKKIRRMIKNYGTI